MNVKLKRVIEEIEKTEIKLIALGIALGTGHKTRNGAVRCHCSFNLLVNLQGATVLAACEERIVEAIVDTLIASRRIAVTAFSNAIFAVALVTDFSFLLKNISLPLME